MAAQDAQMQDFGKGVMHGDGHHTAADTDMAAQPLSETPKSAGLFKRTAAELLGSVGFVSMFAAVGSALIPALATVIPALATTPITAALATGFTVATAATIGTGLVIGVAAVAASLALKGSIQKNDAAIKEAGEKKAKDEQPAQVIVNNIQVQPNVEIETEAKFFTKLIEAERAQLAHKEPQR